MGLTLRGLCDRVPRKLAIIPAVALIVLAGAEAPVRAQDHPDQTMKMDANMVMGPTDPAQTLLLSQASGTSMNPASLSLEGFHFRPGGWTLMIHGAAFLADVQQTGPRGGDKFFSANWFMGMAEHPAGKTSFLIRAMLSLDPATITKQRYPELFQTGETAFGKPLVDGQHPHNLFMELSVEFARPMGEKKVLSLYFAPVGDPALGPVGFAHRESASELPQAPLSHHLQDSTHISDDVITAGLHFARFGIEASGFHGGEPNENRWTIDQGAVDSWAARFILTPRRNWSAQVSAGRLHKPEALEPGDQIRSTASVSYRRPFNDGYWSTSLIWGRSHKTIERRNLDSYLAESVVRFRERNFITGRIEVLDRDELFADQPAIQQQLAAQGLSVFRIAAYTLGYTRDVGHIPGVETGIGGNFSLYTVLAALKPFYGKHPASFYLLLRMRLKSKTGAMTHDHGN